MAGEENTNETEQSVASTTSASVSSSPVPSASSSGEASNEPSIFTDQEKQLIQKTEEHYSKKQYSSCLKCLQNLIASIQQNSSNFSSEQQQQYVQTEFKLLMNKAICDFAIGSFRKVDEFKQELKKLCSDSKINLEKLDTLESEQHCIIFFNYAIVLYYLKQYSQCLKIVEKIYTQFNETLDDKFSRQVSIMLINLYVEMRLPYSALNVLQATERTLNGKSSTSPVGSSPKAAKSVEDSADEQLSFYQQLLSVFKIRCYLMINSTSMSDKELKQLMSTNSRGIKLSTISNLKMQHDFINENYSGCIKQLIIDCIANLKAVDSSVSNNLDIQQLLAIVNSSFNLNNMLNASNMNVPNMNQVMNPILSALGGVPPVNSHNSLLQSNSILYQFFTLTKCLTDFTQPTSEDKDASIKQNIANLNTFLFNNLSVVYYSLQKYNLSSLYLQRALGENRKFISSVKQETDAAANAEARDDDDGGGGERKSYLAASAMNRHYELLYNTGITLLYAKQPVAAFECLSKVAPIFNQNARLWLRLAECCVMYANSKPAAKAAESDEESGVAVSGNERMMKTSEKLKCIQKSLGASFHHKIIVGSSINRDPVHSGDALSVSNLKSTESLEKLMTFDYAYVCLKNALDLVPSNKEIFESSAKSANKHIIDVSSNFKSMSAKSNGDGEGNDDDDLNDIDANAESGDAGNDESNASDMFSPKAGGKGGRTKSNQLQLFNIVWPSKPIDLAELQNLRSSILVSLAYVSLCLKDYLGTIKYSNALLDVEDALNAQHPVSKGNKYLANSYIAEAHFYLDKMNDALEHLKTNSLVDTMNDISFNPFLTSFAMGIENGHDAFEERNRARSQNFINQLKSYYPRDLNMFKAIAFYNLSVAYVIRNEIDTSYKYFNLCVNLFEKKQPAYTYFMKLYLDLLDGNRNSLQYVIKDHFGHVTLNKTTQVVSNTATSLVPPNQQRQAAAPGVAASVANAGMMIGQSGAGVAGSGVPSSGLAHHIQPHHLQQLQQSTHFQQLQQQQSHFQQLQQQQQQPAQAQALQLQMQQLQMQLLQHQLQQQQLQSHILQSQPINQFLNNQTPIGLAGTGASATNNAALTLAVAAAAAAAEKNRTTSDH